MLIYFIISCVRLEFFFFVYFISILQKMLQEKGYTNPRPCFGCYYESR